MSGLRDHERIHSFKNDKYNKHRHIYKAFHFDGGAPMSFSSIYKSLLNKLIYYNVYSLIFSYIADNGYIFHGDLRRLNNKNYSIKALKYLLEKGILKQIEYTSIDDEEEARLLSRNGYGRYHLEEKTKFYAFTDDFIEFFKKFKMYDDIKISMKKKVRIYNKRYKKDEEAFIKAFNLRKLDKEIRDKLQGISKYDIKKLIQQSSYKKHHKKNSIKLVNQLSLFNILKDNIKRIKNNFEKITKRKIHAEIYILRKMISSQLPIEFISADAL